MTINQAFELLKNANNTTDARIVLREILGAKKFSDNKDEPLSLTMSTRIRLAARQLKRGFPVAKIIRKKWFYALEFETGRLTLDPRPDSETLVSAVLETVPNYDIKILDMGTGTGCLIAAVLKNTRYATGIGIDKSFGACRVARRNISRLGLADKIEIKRANFKNPKLKNQKFDIIMSNPPYIAIGDTRVNQGARFDPKMALYADKNGLAAYMEIAYSAKQLLASDGKIFLEIGTGMGESVRKIFEENGWTFVDKKNDLGGIARVLIFLINNK